MRLTFSQLLLALLRRRRVALYALSQITCFRLIRWTAEEKLSFCKWSTPIRMAQALVPMSAIDVSLILADR